MSGTVECYFSSTTPFNPHNNTEMYTLSTPTPTSRFIFLMDKEKSEV